MALERYRRVLGRSAVRRLLLLGFLVRTPIFAGGIVLTLHVVWLAEKADTAAGLVSAALTLAIAAAMAGRCSTGWGCAGSSSHSPR